jgi:hypothetical protein
MMRSGKCLCGRVTFRFDTDEMLSVSCHCRDCQYVAGGHPAVVVSIPAAALEVSGGIQEFRSKADSGTEVRRVFCPSCGTHLFAANAAAPDRIVVKLGVLDDVEGLEPKLHIWTDSAQPWHHIAPTAMRVPKQ